LVAEDFALVGSRYFPQDGLLHYYTGLARVRQGRQGDAILALREAVSRVPEIGAARLFLCVLLLREGRTREAKQLLKGRKAVRADDRRAEVLLERLEQWMFWRRVMVGTGYSAASLGLVATILAGWFGLIPVGLGLGIAATGLVVFRRELDRVAGWQRFEDVSQGVRRLKRSTDGLVS
jgi:hypothetical protein